MASADSSSANGLDSFEELVTAVRQRREISYIALSTIAFLAYDIAIILSKEVELIWRWKWSAPKALYLFARYYGILYLIIVVADIHHLDMKSIKPPGVDFLQTCRQYFAFYTICGNIFFTTVVNVILLLRLYGLYKCSRKVLIFLVTLLVGKKVVPPEREGYRWNVRVFFTLLAEFTVELYVTIAIAIEIRKSAYVAPPGVPLSGCLTVIPSLKTTLISWIPCLVLTAIFFFMTVAQVFSSSMVFIERTNWITMVKSFCHSDSISPLLVALLRDGALHFFCITVILMINTILTIVVPGPYSGAASEWLIAVYSVSGSRLILNLRDTAHRRHESPSEGIALQSFRVSPPSSGQETYSSYTSRMSF